MLLDKDTSVVSQYNPAKTLLYNVLIDRDGNIAKVFQGYNPGDEVAAPRWKPSWVRVADAERPGRLALGLSNPALRLNRARVHWRMRRRAHGRF